MKRLSPILIAALALGLAAPVANTFGQETDDYGFPIESASSSAPQTRRAHSRGIQRRRSIGDRRQRPGKGFWANQRASRSLQHARSYSRDLYRYSRDATVVRPEVAKSESENLGRNIEFATKEFATVRKALEGNKEAAAALDSIGKHLAKAAETHAHLHKECCKDSPDGQVCASCCSDITKELDKAVAEHDALMRTLDGQVNAEASTK